MMHIGVDLGGHTIRGALVADGRILVLSEETTPQGRKPLDVLGKIAEMVCSLDGGGKARGVGIGVPGMLDAMRKKVLRLPNFPLWKNFDLRGESESLLGLPVVIENDANCFAKGEGLCGSARGLENFVALTVGTGIGGGVVLGGALLKGSHGMAAEFGHAAVASRVLCGCGGLGHSETLAGADGLERAFSELGAEVDIPSFWLLRDQEPYRQIWQSAMDALARTVATAVHFFDPQAVILGGGLSKGKGFLDALQRPLEEYLAEPFRECLDLRLASLGSNAAVIGAAALAAEEEGGFKGFPITDLPSS